MKACGSGVDVSDDYCQYGFDTFYEHFSIGLEEGVTLDLTYALTRLEKLINEGHFSEQDGKFFRVFLKSLKKNVTAIKMGQEYSYLEEYRMVCLLDGEVPINSLQEAEAHKTAKILAVEANPFVHQIQSLSCLKWIVNENVASSYTIDSWDDVVDGFQYTVFDPLTGVHSERMSYKNISDRLEHEVKKFCYRISNAPIYQKVMDREGYTAWDVVNPKP